MMCMANTYHVDFVARVVSVAWELKQRRCVNEPLGTNEGRLHCHVQSLALTLVTDTDLQGFAVVDGHVAAPALSGNAKLIHRNM